MSPAKKRVERQTIVTPPEDLFDGLGDFVPVYRDGGRYQLHSVEVKTPTKAQRKKIIERVIDKLDPPRLVIKPEKAKKPKPVAQKEKPVKRAPKPKPAPKPKKGKKVGKLNEVMLKSPGGHVQSIPLVPDLRELLLDGWVIVGDDTAVNEAYSFLNFNPEELQSA